MAKEFTQADMRESMKAFSLDTLPQGYESEAPRESSNDPETLDTPDESRMDLGVAFQWLYLRENSLIQETLESWKSKIAEYESRSKNIRLGSNERMAFSDRATGLEMALTGFGEAWAEASARVAGATQAELGNLSPEQGRIYFSITKKNAKVPVATPATTVKTNQQLDVVVQKNTRKAIGQMEKGY
jgi:hypothetical protein